MRKLTDVDFVGESPIAEGIHFYLLAAARQVRVRDCRILSMWVQTCPSHPLRKLELHNLTAQPLEVEEILKEAALSRLEYLSLDTLQCEGEDLPASSKYHIERYPGVLRLHLNDSQYVSL